MRWGNEKTNRYNTPSRLLRYLQEMEMKELSVELTLTAEDVENIIHWERSHSDWCSTDCEITFDDNYDTSDDRTLAKITLAKERMATYVPVEDEKSV